jgi:hypothetical protein
VGLLKREEIAMRFVAAVLIALGVMAGAAYAKTAWNGAGWYVVADTIVGPFVWTGPYTDQSVCEASRPPNEEDADYACEYLSESPTWDY